MRILICGTNYTPELVGIGKFTGEMAEQLVQLGHEVRVVTALPHYPAWEIDKRYSAWGYQREKIAGVEVFRCPVWVKKNPSGLHRVIHLVSFALSSFPVMLGQRPWCPDIVMAIEPPLTAAPAAALLAKLCGSHCWLHIQDFEIDAALNLGLLPNRRWFERALKRFETWLMRRFDMVSTISDRMLALLDRKGIDRDKTVLFPNWVDVESTYPLAETAAAHQFAETGEKIGNIVIEVRSDPSSAAGNA